MIEKMNFISISGPRDDLDRLVNQTLSKYEIHLEHALTELKSASKLVPYPGNNPYRAPYLKAKQLAGRLTEPSALPEDTNNSLHAHEAAALINEIFENCATAAKEQEALLKKIEETAGLLEHVELYRELDFDIPAILKFEHIKYRFGRIQKLLYPQLEHFAESSDDTILYKCHETDTSVSLIYFTPSAVSERIDAVFSSLQFERIYLPDEYAGTPGEEAERLEGELNRLREQKAELKAKEHTLLETRTTDILRALQVLESYDANFNVRKFAACTHDKDHPFYILCGWIAADQARSLRADLAADKNTFFVIEDGSRHSTAVPPTKLKNFPLFRPFEMFARMYGLPAYGEFDPTTLIAITYSVFFGFMFGDAGQGLLLLIGGFLLYKIKRLDLAAIVSCCGFFSTIFGLLFGSVFGFEDILPALWLRPASAMTSLPFVGRLNTVFVTAIILGMCMILFTMILNMLIGLRSHDPEKTWFGTNGLAGFIFYLNLAAVIVLYMSGKPLPAAAILVIMFLLPLLIIFLKEPLTAVLLRQSRKISGSLGMFFVEGFFELFEVLLSYFSNTLSFVRVGAFAVSHAAMMQVVLMLAGAETGNLSIPVVVLGNLFVCGMEGLIVGIQVLRLEYYELFGRFYKGTGREFQPFRKQNI